MGAGLGVAITIAVASNVDVTPRQPTSGVEYSPAAAATRWTGTAFDVEDVGIIADFDMTGTSLYLLDAMNHRVRMLTRQGEAWTDAGEFGRRGAGPGEFTFAHGLAVTRDGRRVVIADDGRLHFFTAAGDYLHSHALLTECRLQRPRVAAGVHGFFVSGNCYRTGIVTDTMASDLYWTEDGSRYEPVASDVRFTRDGRTGSFMSALSPFTESDSLHLFGTGSNECLSLIIERSVGETDVQRQCGVVKARYSAPAPADMIESLRSEGAARGMESLFAWPDPLPAYIDRIAVDGTALLVRPFTADSIVIEQIGSAAPLLVAGLDGLVSCRRSGCLWTESTLTGARLRFLAVDEIRAIIAHAHAEGSW